jgi:hypothetical protein
MADVRWIEKSNSPMGISCCVELRPPASPFEKSPGNNVAASPFENSASVYVQASPFEKGGLRGICRCVALFSLNEARAA